MKNQIALTRISLALISLAVIGLDGPLRAEPIAIENPSFEADLVPDGGTLHTITGWDTSAGGGDGVFNPTVYSYPVGPPDGGNVAYANLPGNRVRQELTAVLEADRTYTLEVEVGNRQDVSFEGYIIQLRAGGVVLAEDNSSQSPGPGEFATSIVNYTAFAGDPQLGEPLEILLLSTGIQANFDNVRLNAVVVPVELITFSVSDH